LGFPGKGKWRKHRKTYTSSHFVRRRKGGRSKKSEIEGAQRNWIINWKVRKSGEA